MHREKTCRCQKETQERAALKKQREEKFWSKFKEDKPAIFGLFTVVLLLFVAIYAPLIANGRPFLLLDRTTG
ncbi:MAG: hypothetical protein IKD09_01880, partial [Lentisphaeria bacterium]|nr:hypothetical protein [Lentisphaeria bacterium]